MKWLQDKKTILGSLAAGLLTVGYALDRLIHDLPDTVEVETWLAEPVYLMLAGAITTWTGVALRLAVKKSTPT